jgi:regulatory protein YycI of two-component signal transduction system YycFG
MQPQQSKSTSNLFIVIGVIIALVVAGYFYFTRDRSSDAVLTSDSIENVQNDLVVILQKLQTVTLNSAILASIQETILHEGNHILFTEVPGRNNPFAPLSLTSVTQPATNPASASKATTVKK